MLRFASLPILCLVALCGSANIVSAQYSAIAGPFNNAGSGYYERLGFGFGGNVGGVFFNNGGMNNALPPFGGHNPADDARFGFGVRGNGVNLNFGIAAGAGYDANMTSVTPSITLPNGGTGGITDVIQRPFVTSLVPYVGHFSPGVGYSMAPPRVVSPLAERLSRLESGERPAARPSEASAPARTSPASTAERGDLSLAEIRARQAAAGDREQDELAAFLEAGRLREEAGEYGQAIIDYGRAAARAKGAQQEQLRAKLRELRAKTKK
jgi:hypothetical protein